MIRTIDMAELGVSDDPATTFATHSLGSCLGVAVYDGERRVGGLLHFMLPESAIAPDDARANPAMFCDTGLPALFRAAYDLGADKQRLIVKVAGGGQLLADDGTFAIGKRNYLAMLRILRRSGVNIAAEDVGGSAGRGMTLEMATGRVLVRTRDREVTL